MKEAEWRQVLNVSVMVKDPILPEGNKDYQTAIMLGPSPAHAEEAMFAVDAAIKALEPQLGRLRVMFGMASADLVIPDLPGITRIKQ